MAVPTLARIIPILREALCDDKRRDTKELIETVCDRFKLVDEERSKMMARGATCSPEVAVWVAAATLHRGRENDGPLTKGEIVDMVMWQGICNVNGSSMQDYISTDFVANSTPRSARYRVLFRVSRGRFRLCRPGDESGSCKNLRWAVSKPNDLPVEYSDLWEWWTEIYCGKGG